MYKLTARLLLYSDLGGDSILEELSHILDSLDHDRMDKDIAIRGIYTQIKRLLDLSTAYGFDGNLWQNYLTFLLITNENSFTLTAERAENREKGSVHGLAEQDFEVFRKLFHFDFAPVEEKLGVDCFTRITNYKAIPKRACLYNKSVSEKVRELSEKLAKCHTALDMAGLILTHYHQYGVGMFGMNRAFRIRSTGAIPEFLPINNAEPIRLTDLVGYERQKAELVANTRAFVEGKKANNVLLYGDSGTGKSSCIKAVLNEYYDQGLRMIEIYKHQFTDLSAVIAAVKNRNYRFIIYIDDLSFEEHEIEYKFLKAVIEGGVETRPENVLIYATSNRRHLIRETWGDRADMQHDPDAEIHRSDTIEEKLSLSARFGVTINFSSPDRQLFYDIVDTLTEREGIVIDREVLHREANRWEIRHGGVSGRAARQFVDHLLTQYPTTKD